MLGIELRQSNSRPAKRISRLRVDPVRWRGDDGTLRKVVVLQDRVLNRAAEKMMLAGNIEKFSLQLVAVR
ncbi:hypothetical protein [Bradyrhizobium zhanjiangense]|uniref:Uncharacterized protein n=1 Tax=Bradyrhizobium zhanjiangense TaxID=1325107 RepID=A0A4Q0QZF4_9BRAD|nr:hypothetical protein [Bradyrhizobium zhanjiangense]RXH02426.1 hypothetical protein EAS61_02940 [Bradyrhizobium zhanjiangense]